MAEVPMVSAGQMSPEDLVLLVKLRKQGKTYKYIANILKTYHQKVWRAHMKHMENKNAS